MIKAEGIDIERLARLARIAVDDDEYAPAIANLQRIIGMIDEMQSVDTDGVQPMAHPLDASQRLRLDRVTETVDRDQLQTNAPEVADGYYLVPRVVE